jgi:acetyl esterase
MPLDPLLAPIVELVGSATTTLPEGTPIDDRRAAADVGMEQFCALMEPPPRLATVTDHEVAVSRGTITVRLYETDGAAALPCHLYLHGGGFWSGEIGHFDTLCHTIAVGVDCTVASVGYRLAPEHKYPTPAEDCYAALLWLVEHADDLGIDAAHLSVGGGSAGANLAAVVALMARDRNGPVLALQVLEAPVIDLVGDYPSYEENGSGYVLTRESIDEFRGYYIADAADGNEPYASPILAETLRGVAPAVVMTSELDPLRDEGEAYAARLLASGVPVHARRWQGQIHGAGAMTALLPSARECRDEVLRALRGALHGNDHATEPNSRSIDAMGAS